ncbi:hypothetical protein FRB94_006208 [Tulasnella sp. JGI-2019a]|nr:hypothetical protein FRB94_006208 [Tulasnella sp. JGI-2019a]
MIASILKMTQNWRNRTKQAAPSILATNPGRLTMQVMPSGYAIKRMDPNDKRIFLYGRQLQDPNGPSVLLNSSLEEKFATG